MRLDIATGVAPLPTQSAEKYFSRRLAISLLSEATFRAILSVSFCCLLLFASCLPGFCSAWTRQPSGTMAWLHAVYFLDQNRGWVAGSNGTLLQTADGGTTWKKLSLLTRDSLDDVYFADERNGWLLGSRDFLKLRANEPPSYVLKTEDGGLSWRQLSLNTSDSNTRFVRMLFTDAKHGWVFGETGVILATNDGGAHWIRQVSVTKHLLLGGSFADYQRGCLVGAGATVLRTSDSGATWQAGIMRDGGRARLTSASLFQNFGWTVGAAGQIFATKDGGRSWLEQRSNADADLLDVRFIDEREGWVAGTQGTLLHTIDGGVHWFTEKTESPHALQRIFIADRDHVWVVGFGGTILRMSQSNAPKLKG